MCGLHHGGADSAGNWEHRIQDHLAALNVGFMARLRNNAPFCGFFRFGINLGHALPPFDKPVLVRTYG